MHAMMMLDELLPWLRRVQVLFRRTASAGSEFCRILRSVSGQLHAFGWGPHCGARRVRALIGEMWRIRRWVGLICLCSACGGRAGAEPSQDLGCHADFDCKGDRICVFGYCEDPAYGGSNHGGSPPGVTPQGGRPPMAGGGANDGGRKSGTTGGVASGGRNESGGSAGAAAGGNAMGVQVVKLEARALVADPARGLLYATLPGNAARFANNVVVIDVETAAVKQSVFVGSEPSCLTLSDDGSTLWVGLSGAFAVRSVDVSSEPPVAGMLHNLPPGDFGDLAAAGTIVVLPGTTESIVVSLHRSGVSPSFSGLVVLDAGVPRPNVTRGHTGASRLTAGPPGYVFGFNNLHTGFGFYSVRVGADGLTQTEHGDLLSGFDSDITYDSDFIFGTGGEVVDVSDPEAPLRAGRFPFRGHVVPSVADGYVYMLSTSDSTQQNPTLRLLDVTTFTQLNSEVLPFSVPQARTFVRSGPDRFALIESSSSSAFDQGTTSLRLFAVSGFTP